MPKVQTHQGFKMYLWLLRSVGNMQSGNGGEGSEVTQAWQGPWQAKSSIW